MLDEREQQAIRAMRRSGAGFKRIATTLGVNRETVRYCLRAAPAPAKAAREDATWCAWCGVLLPGGARRRRFCSSEHRRAWWAAHPEEMVRHAFYEFTCAGCSAVFKAYGNQTRKYCSHPCYIRTRFHTRGGKS